MKHTPGPWVVNESQEDCLYGKVSIETEDEYFIAQVDESVNQAANARLIAAAPDLLEALQEIFHDVKQGAIPNDDDGWWKKASTAIAKATGEP